MRFLPFLALLTGCAAPDVDELFQTLELYVESDASAANAHFFEVFEAAENTLDIAIPGGADTELTDKIIDTYNSGVEVRVVTDIDQQDDPGIQDLFDAGVPTTLADDSITYFDFNVSRDITWTSDQAIMSHAFAIADQRLIINATEMGSGNNIDRVLLRATGTDLGYDVWAEHNQVFGGADAVSTTAFDNLAKSIADFRWQYMTNSELVLEVWFGPQERVSKHVIDGIYNARSSVKVLTNDMTNDGLANALQDKAEWGFDVQAIVGPAYDGGRADSQAFQRDTRDVPKRVRADVADLPTIVLVDADGDNNTMARAFIISHDLYKAKRVDRADLLNAPQDTALPIQGTINDQFIDGSLWILDDATPKSVAPEMQALLDLFDAHWQDAGDL